MNITQNIQKWGNGTGIIIPKKVMQAANLQVNQTLIVSLQNDSILLTPLQDKKVSLEAMLKGVTPALVNGAIEWGDDLGAEKN